MDRREFVMTAAGALVGLATAEMSEAATEVLSEAPLDAGTRLRMFAQLCDAPCIEEVPGPLVISELGVGVEKLSSGSLVLYVELKHLRGSAEQWKTLDCCLRAAENGQKVSFWLQCPQSFCLPEAHRTPEGGVWIGEGRRVWGGRLGSIRARGRSPREVMTGFRWEETSGYLPNLALRAREYRLIFEDEVPAFVTASL